MDDDLPAGCPPHKRGFCIVMRVVQALLGLPSPWQAVEVHSHVVVEAVQRVYHSCVRQSLLSCNLTCHCKDAEAAAAGYRLRHACACMRCNVTGCCGGTWLLFVAKQESSTATCFYNANMHDTHSCMLQKGGRRRAPRPSDQAAMCRVESVPIAVACCCCCQAAAAPAGHVRSRSPRRR